MRRILLITLVLSAAATLTVLGPGAGEGDSYRVRAIFDNAVSVIPGEDVKIAGVRVGKIDSLDVTPDNKAAVVLKIERAGFQDFRRDARCLIRPQSLIGEKFVECVPTEPRSPGSPPAPALRKIEEGAGEGQYLLPVERNSAPVDLDLINNTLREPYRERLSLIINELGTGLAGRGDELRQVIRRANPALQQTDRVLKLLAGQNQILADLVTDSDKVIAPLARDRGRISSFITKANETAEATAERRTDLERNIDKLPKFLSELRPTMARLGGLTDQATPVLSDLGDVAPDVNRLIRELGPFSEAGIPALDSLGEATKDGRPALDAFQPIARDLRRFAGSSRPLANNLAALTTSLRDTGGIERLMDYIFYQVAAINGFDQYGHYLRAALLVNLCSDYAIRPALGCSANFLAPSAASASASRPRATLGPELASRPANQRGADDRQEPRRAPRGEAPLKLPRLALPGRLGDPPAAPRSSPDARAQAPRSAQPAPAGAPANTGLLDYLLGGEG